MKQTQTHESWTATRSTSERAGDLQSFPPIERLFCFCVSTVPKTDRREREKWDKKRIPATLVLRLQQHSLVPLPLLQKEGSAAESLRPSHTDDLRHGNEGERRRPHSSSTVTLRRLMCLCFLIHANGLQFTDSCRSGALPSQPMPAPVTGDPVTENMDSLPMGSPLSLPSW